MASETPSMMVTPAKVGFFLSLVAALTVGWNVVSYFKARELHDFAQDQKILAVEDAGKRFNQSISKLTDKTDELKESIIRLTTVIEQGAPEKRAEYFFENRAAYPSLAAENK